MLLKLAKDKNHRELVQNQWALGYEEFNDLTNKQWEFVVLFTDFESPIPKGLPEPQRRKLAALQSGRKTRQDKNNVLDTRGLDLVHGKVETVERAIRKYRDIQEQTNEDYKMLDFLNKRIDHLKIEVAKPSSDIDDEVKKTKLTKELFELFETKKSFESKIGKQEDPNVVGEVGSEEEDGTTRNLSLIDRIE